MSESRYPLFASVAPGLEPLLQQEWAALQPDVGPSERRGGVAARGTLAELRAFLVATRLAESARVRIGSFEAKHFDELQRGVERIAWHAWVPDGSMPNFRVVCRKSKLYHSGAVEERVRLAVDRCLRRPPTRTEGTVHVRLVKDRATISIDAGGELLHRRGWREHVADASFRETMAAALLSAAGWNRTQPLVDPFCGAGTVVIEAATIAAGQLPRAGHTFAMDTWPVVGSQELPPAQAQSPVSPMPVLVGSDRNEQAVTAARANAASAELAEAVQFEPMEVADAIAAAPEGAAVITNLPYGKRLAKGDDLAASLRDFGRALKARPDLVPVLVLSDRSGLNNATKLSWEPVFRTNNRGIGVFGLQLTR